MGGIDVDPASSPAANEVVGASTFYTIDDDGLTQPWSGRVWLNPPYENKLLEKFCAHLGREYSEGNVTAAIVLTNNATETRWFQGLALHASAICFPAGRVSFWHPDKTTSTPPSGQAVLYLGDHPDTFAREFQHFGVCVRLGAR
jgi:hypothetical protein